MTKLAVIGCGNMATAIVEGLIDSGWDAAQMRLTTRRPEHAKQLAERLGATATSNVEAVKGADIVLVAVKPVDVPKVLREISPTMSPDAIVVSVAVGLPTDLLEKNLPDGTAVVRVLPNTPSALGYGMAVLCGGKNASEAQIKIVEEMLGSVGKTLVLAEKYLNLAGAISGSGTGYLFYIAEAIVEAGVTFGLTRADAQLLTAQSLFGASAMLANGEHPTMMREAVTSPGGTTAAAVRKLENRGVKAAFLDAIEACTDRSFALAELAAEESSNN